MEYFTESDEMAAAKAQKLIADIPLMPGITGIRVEPYTDNTGDPSLRLIFSMSKDVNFGKDFLAQFREFSFDVQTKILHSDLNRFPYTKLQEAA